MSGDQEPLIWTLGSLKCLRPNALLAEAVSRLSPRSDDLFWQRKLGSLRKSPNKVLSAQTSIFCRYFLPAFAPILLSKSAIKTKPNKETNISPAVSPPNFLLLLPHLSDGCLGVCSSDVSHRNYTLSVFYQEGRGKIGLLELEKKDF